MTAFYSCEIRNILTSPGHSSAPDEALYWLKCVVGIGGLCITPIVSQATPFAEALYWLKCVVGIGGLCITPIVSQATPFAEALY